MVRTRRTLAATLLATLALLPSLASARPAAPPARATAHTRAAASSADPLSRLWHGLRTLWSGEGMTIDPNGARLAGSGTAGQTAPAILIAPKG